MRCVFSKRSDLMIHSETLGKMAFSNLSTLESSFEKIPFRGQKVWTESQNGVTDMHLPTDPDYCRQGLRYDISTGLCRDKLLFIHLGEKREKRKVP